MYASHNSLTAYSEKRWYMKILRPFSRCQKKSIDEQINAGVKFFDIRLRIKNGKYVVCHGLVEYNINALTAIRILEYSNVYYRIVLENKLGYKGNSNRIYKELELLKGMFLRSYCPHCCYISDKRSWYKIYNKYCPLIKTGEINCHTSIPIFDPFIKRKKRREKEIAFSKKDYSIVRFFDFV